MKSLVSLFLMASFVLIAGPALASDIDYSCKSIANTNHVQTLSIEANLVFPNKIVWTSAQGYSYKFPGETTPVLGVDFGYRGHVFESTSLNQVFLGITFEQTLYIDTAVLQGGDTGVVVETTSYSSVPENAANSVAVFECTRRID